ncbi:MAG TPA: hypothetical protein VFN82_05380 [Solirubrobacterales bacterium]|nr:hypothetical protein [Solirubrobacterales bacterium]
MAYVVATKPGRFEVRESRSTAKGPRSRTLASFTELTEDVIAKVRERAENPPAPAALRALAAKAGAPVPGPEVDEAARRLIRLLAEGKRPSAMLRKLLLDVGENEHRGDLPAHGEAGVSHAARSAAEWIGVGPEERAKTLRDLLELADALPVRLRPQGIRCPRLKSA